VAGIESPHAATRHGVPLRNASRKFGLRVACCGAAFLAILWTRPGWNRYFYSCASSYIIEKGHKTEIHMELLVAVEQC
jgi:hypothetical protein